MKQQQVISLRKAMKENYVSVGTEIRYEPDYNEIEAIEKRTGVKEKQKFKTNMFSWRLIELENKQLALIPMESTNMTLTLQGKAGAEKSKKTLDIICKKLWSSKRLNLEAKTLDMIEYEQMPLIIKKTIKNVWLGGHYPAEVNGDFVELVHYADMNSCSKNYPLYARKRGEQSLSKEILPIIYLPNDMLIDLSTKMIFRQPHQVAKYKLAILIETEKLPKEVKTQLEEILKLMKHL